jgi:hypothetical protein
VLFQKPGPTFPYAMKPVHVLLDEGHVGIDNIKLKKEKGFLEPKANPAASYLSTTGGTA